MAVNVRFAFDAVRPVAIRKSGSVVITTVDAKSVDRPSGYMKRLVPLNRAKSGRVQAIALSSVSAAYSKLTDTRPARAG